jgi:acylpyruvate hydrolase
MRFFSYLENGKARYGRQVEEIGIDLRRAVDLFEKLNNNVGQPKKQLPDSLVDVFRSGKDGIERITRATDWIFTHYAETKLRKSRIVFNLHQVKLLAPIPQPGKVICLAGNYPIHNQMEKPQYPTIFLKPSSSVIGQNADILLPELAQNAAYEVELVVVIGKRCQSISIQDVPSVIAGYSIANDVGDRDLEKRTSQWTSGKMFDTFTPMGPLLVTPDEVTKSESLEMVTRLNGEVVQQGNTSQMFFGIPELVRYVSTLTTLEVGDVILTGSPKLMNGSPNPERRLSSGDIIEVEIENLGCLSNPVITESQVSL